jgi:phage protein D
MLTPAYKFTIGQSVVDTTSKPQASTAVDLLVELDIDTPADSFQLVLGNVNGIKPKLDDTAEIAMGYSDNGGVSTVFTGFVARLEPSLTETRVYGSNGSATLLRTYSDQTYEEKTAGEIVSDLCGQASVDVANADDGITFPAYVVDGRRSAYRHILDLAGLCGFDSYIDNSGKLVFEKFTGGNAVHDFEYAKHILELEVARSPLAASEVDAWGESPGSGRGDNAWAWLTKDFSGLKGTAGSAKPGPVLLLERPALRTSDAAQTAAAAAFSAIESRAVRGRLLSLGRPEVTLGDAIHLLSVPDQSLNQVYQVRSVSHRITKAKGFTTAIGFRAISK